MAGVDVATLAALSAAATALAGSVVAGLAYRGGRRNDSAAMRYLAVGIACIAVLPGVLVYGLTPLLALSDAMVLLAVMLSNVAGLLAILYSLEGT
ncbi:hypothetical protein G9C85_07535 [Halorubellus sp. JP-L1]|uniref:DUF7521 family protein n=1 Tax=Halorubellus sp. JP-L1 TaxID=2715753 RepID=UPI001408652E|nr:hypothetical protein [Halorubellus sp. JP-L1]NHN41488.1 hypothetical protein [Halorubellus sp. JP-L1]